MTTEKLQCPKCKDEMVQGFVLDNGHHIKGIIVQGWHEGQPKKSFWSGTKLPSTEGVPIGAFRCQKCGFLELYADARFAAQ